MTADEHAHELISLINTLNVAASGMERWMAAVLVEGRHPDFSELRLLAVVSAGAVYPTDIARALGMAGPSVSQLIRRMTDKGLLTSVADSVDRRKRRITVTPMASAALHDALARVMETIETGRYKLDSEALGRLGRQVQKFMKGMRIDY